MPKKLEEIDMKSSPKKAGNNICVCILELNSLIIKIIIRDSTLLQSTSPTIKVEDSLPIWSIYQPCRKVGMKALLLIGDCARKRFSGATF
jgi:hypothetical protein